MKKLKSILDQKLKCPKCNLIAKLGSEHCVAEADITPEDDDGNICCNRCWVVMRVKAVMEMENNKTKKIR